MTDQGDVSEDISDKIDISEVHIASTQFKFNDLSFQDRNKQAKYEFYQGALITTKSTFTRHIKK